MRHCSLLLPVASLAGMALLGVASAEDYPLGPDSQRHEGVPRGAVTHHTWTSTVFPGTVREYWVYVPAQYNAEKPACVMVFQDGGGFADERSGWHLPIVFDNLIAQGAMPVTVGVFVNPGVLPPAEEGRAGRPNRSFEYDAVSDRYARFLLEEILPEVGRDLNLSRDPNDRAICGASSGGICAFTAAWFRPDAFRRVLSFIGSFTNLRGGDVYASLIRKSETKPLRVFLQSGKRDMNTYAGSWYIANQHMMSSFEYMGYDARLVLGEEGHNGIQGASILPDALRWLWRDYPAPIAAPQPPATREWATDVFAPGSAWEEAGQDAPAEAALDPTRAIGRSGGVYAIDPTVGTVSFTPADGGPRQVCADVASPSGVRLSPDGSLLMVADATSRWVWSYRVEADGTPSQGEAFYRLERADDTGATGAGGMTVDRDGYLYVATTLGIQVLDPEGRCALIIANPPGGAPSALAFGGPEQRTLYAVANGLTYQRAMQRQGVAGG
jgi:gluconolactonase